MSGVARFLVGDKTGALIAELEPAIGPISWRLNDIGRVQFAIPSNQAKATEGNLRFGNRVLIQFDNGLPDWGGVIDTPRSWENGMITSTAYSGEYLLTFRQTNKGCYFSGAAVGAIFRAVINDANAQQPMGIEIGSIWAGGSSHSPDYHFASLFDIIQDSICTRLSDADFDVIGSISGNKILFTANLYERKGRDLDNVALIEGHNLSDDASLTEQGPIINWWDVAGQGNNWGGDRLTSNEEDSTSRAAYDLRQDSKVYSDVSLQVTLDAHAATLLAESKDPHNLLELNAINTAPALFSAYGVGDSVRVILPSYGFGGTDTTVRILAREFNPANGQCKLVVRQE